MVKQLIATATLLLIQDIPEAIYYVRTIFDLIMLTQYLSYNNETLFYMLHVLYRLDKTKIAFENHCPINVKLIQPTFNYLKFYAMTNFVQYIRNYNSTINYDTAHNEVAYKYFLKTFYGRINKKEYELQILEYNIRHTNVIAMQDVILIAKIPVGNTTKKELVIDMPDVEVTRICSATNVLLKYDWHLDFMDDEVARDLGLQSIKKKWRCAA